MSTTKTRTRTVAKIVSIDLETTGLDPETCDILEFGAVVEDGETPVGELPAFHAYLLKERYRGEPYALAMHPAIFKRIAKREDGFLYIGAAELGPLFRDFLFKHGFPRREEDGRASMTATGKNYGMFDARFLDRIGSWSKSVSVAHRVLDPGTLYFDPRTDEKLPDTKECMRRAGLEGEVAHTAVEDARNVIRLLRHAWNS